MQLRQLFLSLVAVSGALLSITTVAQDLPRTTSGKPDLQGIWQAQGTAAYDLEDHLARHDMPAGMGVVEGSIPYLAAALDTKRANFANRAELDPLNSCYLPGTPRIMTLPYPFHIFQTDDHVAMQFEWTQVWRLIYTHGKPPLYPGIESWMGHSRGQWEGDTLVVTTNDFNDRSWLDAAGNFHSNAMELTERYTLLDENTINYEVTITDPKVFERPWTMTVKLARQHDMDRILEFQCQAEMSEANGDFERDDRTWYPAAAQPGIAAFDANAHAELPLPEAGADIKRLPDGRPDISGYFLADAGGANYGLEQNERDFLTPGTRGVLVDPPDGKLPYQDWARAERIERELPHRGYDDPTAHCFVAGVPRSHYVPSPFFIMQAPGYVIVLHERMSWRQIPLDGRAHLPDHMRLWQGDSIGHWEGDTLVVESTNFNGKTWLNERGDVSTHAQTVVETFTPVSADRVIYRATVSDPLAYTRPWTMELPLDRSEDELLEVACLEDNNDLEHLKDVRDEWRRTGREPE
jgi:hypothetical protein